MLARNALLASDSAATAVLRGIRACEPIWIDSWRDWVLIPITTGKVELTLFRTSVSKVDLLAASWVVAQMYTPTGRVAASFCTAVVFRTWASSWICTVLAHAGAARAN